jgi:mannosyltransferase OCH1-like enzyme
MPDRYRQWGRDLAAMHPDWEYRLWTDGDFGWLENQDVYDAAERLVPDHKVGQLRSNVARYEILNRFGGVWLDADVEPLRPLDGLLGPQAWAGWERQDEWVGTSVMGGDAGRTVLAAMHRRGKGRRVSGSAGSQVCDRPVPAARRPARLPRMDVLPVPDTPDRQPS